MFFKIFVNTFILSLLSSLISCHVFRLGECPDVEPMPDFVMDQFLGEWYVIQKFRSASDCVRENFTKIDDRYFVKRSSKLLGMGGLSSVSGEVFHPKNGSQSEMEIDYPLSTTGVINVKHYVVLATDYDNYALVWNCQQMIVGHRQSAQIMSRTSSLDKKMISELRELFSHYELNEHYFTIVKQNDCESDDKPIVNIDGNVNCDKDHKPGQRADKSGIHVRIGPFHFSATLPFK